MNLKQIINVTVKAKTINILEKNIGESLSDLEFSKEFLDMIPKAQVIKEQINKLNFVKILKICSSKYIIKKIKRNRLEENICKAYIL